MSKPDKSKSKSGCDVWFCHVSNPRQPRKQSPERLKPISQVPLLNEDKFLDVSAEKKTRGRKRNQEALNHNTAHMIRPAELGENEVSVPSKFRKFATRPHAKWFTHREGKPSTTKESETLLERCPIPPWMNHLSHQDQADCMDDAIDENAGQLQPEKPAYVSIPPYFVGDTDYDNLRVEAKPMHRKHNQPMPPMTLPKRFDKNGNPKRIVCIETKDQGFAHLIANQYQEDWIDKEKAREERKRRMQHTGNFLHINKTKFASAT